MKWKCALGLACLRSASCEPRYILRGWDHYPQFGKRLFFGPQFADNFSELSLMEKTLALPFRAEKGVGPGDKLHSICITFHGPEERGV
jgi:hypothetical protein